MRADRSLLQNPLQPWHVEVFRWIILAGSSAVKFFRILHTCGIWIESNTSASMADASGTFCKAYSKLAEICYQHNLCRYHLEPSLHYFCHYAFELQSGDLLPNPALDNCEADEDFIGKVCRLSRCVHAATTSIRVLERHLIKCYFVYENIQL